MTKSQEHQLRMSEVRTELRNISTAETLTDEQRQAEPKLNAELADLETKYRAAVRSEDEAEKRSQVDGEGQEKNGLEQRARLGTFLYRAAAGQPLDGAELELQQADKLPGDAIPFSALVSEDRQAEGQTENRAVTPAPANLPAQSTFVDRVFAGGDAMFLGVMMPSVPAGEAVYNLISAGPEAEAVAKDAAADATAGAFASEVLKPTRIPARFTLRVEDMREDQGLEMAIRRDLSGLLSEALDERIVAGDGTVGSFSPGVAKTTDPANDAATLDYDTAKQLAAANVDGRRARMLSETRLLVGTATYGLMAGLANANGYDALQWTMENAGGLRASAFISAPGANNIQRAVIAKTGARSAAYAPVWEGIRLIRDEVTDAAKGQVHLTAYLLAAFKVVDDASYVLRDLKLA